MHRERKRENSDRGKATEERQAHIDTDTESRERGIERQIDSMTVGQRDRERGGREGASRSGGEGGGAGASERVPLHAILAVTVGKVFGYGGPVIFVFGR